MRLKGRSTVAAALVTAVLLGGCGGDDDDDAASTTTTPGPDGTSTTAAATTTSSGVEQQVLGDYRAAVAAFSAAANPPNPDAPDLLARYTGAALAQIQDRLRSLQAQGVGVINTVETHAAVVSISGDVAVVEDCFIDRTQLVQLATGEAGEQDETIAFLTARLERIDGVWKVAEREGRQEPCEPG